MQSRILLTALGALFSFLLLNPTGRAKAFGSDIPYDPVSLKAYTGLSSASQGGVLPIAVVIKINRPWHINANRVNNEYMIPTEISIDVPEGIEVQNIVYPKSVEKHLPFSEEPLALYEGEVALGFLITVAPDFALGDTTITATVTYQACDNEKCIAPENRQLTVPFRVTAPEEAVDVIHTNVFTNIDFGSGLTTQEYQNGTELDQEGTFGQLVATKGLFLTFLFVFGAGLALNFTPCVYPMIPITIGYFGGQSKGKTSLTVLLAFLYLLGMATMYSTLGLIASLTGSLFGSALQNPYVLSLIALALIALSLSMFGLYEFRVPAKMSNVAGTSKQGLLGSFLMGLTVGIVAAPCIGPFVLGLLTFIGESGNPILGFTLFFTLATGLGLPFVALAILSGSISKLPKSGEWMEWVRKLFGVILIVMAVYFLKTLIANWLYTILTGLIFITSGIILGFILKTHSSASLFLAFRRFIGIAGPLLGLYIILIHGGITGTNEEKGIQWQPFSNEALARAKTEQRYVLIDFYAEWCIPCKELEHKTFSQEEVIEAVEAIVTIKADLTSVGSRSTIQLREKYKIVGVPTVVFIDKEGNERKDLRAVGFFDKSEFLQRLGRLKNSEI